MNQNPLSKFKDTTEGVAVKNILLAEAHKLNRLDDITLTDPNEIALEAKARQRAYETVQRMLCTLFEDSEFGIMQEKDDSISTEMLQEQRSQDSNQE
jgi:hypothetical protein